LRTDPPIVDNNQVTDTHQSLAAITKPLQKPLLDEVTRSGQNKRHGNSSLGLVGPGVCREFPFSILSTSIGRYSDVQLNCARLFSRENTTLSGAALGDLRPEPPPFDSHALF